MPFDERWIALSPLLDEALDLEPAERERWLTELGAVDPARAAEIAAMLAEQAAIDTRFLAGSAPLPHGRVPSAGDSVGAYTLRAPIGRGGMGAVWLADRNDGQFERPVAVKFLATALGAGGRARFRREGAILARLTHPNIAHLLDAGVSDGNHPYLVLEYVEGDPIDRYCAGRALDVEARVRLLLDVAAAVAHAHAAFVVHRDLKPSNVLVRSDGVVKLLDFGIAKLIEEGADLTSLTREAGGALTPDYAAPEQVSGESITAATDVYSLGVLAYMLLTGLHPTSGTTRTPASVVKSIVDTQPRPASQAAPALASRLRGDLDTILAKALKKSPGERYATAASFAGDLQRYLNHQPVAARPDTLTYRTRKFVRRNRAAVALAAAALLATAGGVAGTLMQAAAARSERDFAIQQLARAESVNDLNAFILFDAAPAGRAFRVTDLLAAAEHAVRRQRGDPLNRVGLLVSIGRQYQTSDEDGRARAVLQDAYEQSRQLADPSTRARAACSLASALARQAGGQQRAEQLYDEGMRELPPGPRYVLERIFCLDRGSEVAREAGRSGVGVERAAEAERLLAQAPFRSEVLEQTVTRDLAEALRMDGRFREAAAMMERAAASLTALGRDDTQNAGTLYNNWGLTLNQLGRLDEAERVLRRAIEISRDDKGEGVVSPMLLVNYARVLRDLRRLDEAADYAKRGYDKALASGDDVVTNQALLVRGATYRERGDLARSREMFDAVEPRLRAHLPPGHIAFASLASERALLAQAGGDLTAAFAYAEQALAAAERSVQSGGQGRDYIPVILTRKAGIELQLGRTQEAATDADRAVSMLSSAVAPGTTSLTLTRAVDVRDRARQAAAQTARR